MGEITSSYDSTRPEADGWTVSYTVRRSDDEEVFVMASCTLEAEAAIHERGSPETLAALEDRCSMAAVTFADQATATVGGGRPVVVKLWFDPDEATLRHQYVYPDAG